MNQKQTTLINGVPVSPRVEALLEKMRAKKQAQLIDPEIGQKAEPGVTQQQAGSTAIDQGMQANPNQGFLERMQSRNAANTLTAESAGQIKPPVNIQAHAQQASAKISEGRMQREVEAEVAVGK